jgi:hypothetical protein
VVSFEGDAPERAAFDSSVTMTGETAEKQVMSLFLPYVARKCLEGRL